MLNFRVAGEGRPLVIVHGLFGSGDNWSTLAGKFPGWRVFLPDLRNHGASPWFDTFSHADLAADLLEFQKAQGLGPCPWIGHSLGGKAVMELALSAPAQATGVGVLDAFPKAFTARYPGFVEAMQSLDLATLTSRGEAQQKLSSAVPDLPTLQFLLKSLSRDEAGWRWKLNLEGLRRNYAEVWKPLAGGRSWAGPTLFLYGGASDYYQPGDEEYAQELFPLARFEAVAGAGHWLHAEKPVELVASLNRWLGGIG